VYLNNKALKYTKQKLLELKGETDKPLVVHRNFSVPLSVVKKSSRQKIGKFIDILSNIINQLNIYRTFYQPQLNTHSL
jgi:hypothetical protein